MFENIPVGESVDTATELSAINETADAFAKRCSTFNELINQKRDALYAARRSDFERAGLVSTENGVRTVDKDRQHAERAFIERGITAEVEDYRAQLMESTKQERSVMLVQLQKKQARLNALAEVNVNEAAYLANMGLGSGQHANYVTALAGADKAELTARAKQAILSGDRVLASAIAIVNERKAQRDRPFKTSEFARPLVGQQFDELQAAVAEANDRVKAALDLDAALTRGGESPADKIERGLRNRAASRRSKAA